MGSTLRSKPAWCGWRLVSSPLGFPLRARSELIESDLLALGLSRREIAELPRCTDLPRLSCPEDLAGCLYVLEGACLGGQVIAPRCASGSGWPRAAAHRSSSATRRGPRRGGTSLLAWLEAWRAQARDRGDRRLGVRDLSDFRAMGGSGARRGTPWST